MTIDKKKHPMYCEKPGLMPYGTNISAPAIVLPDTELFKSERGSIAKNYFEQKLDELNKKYQSLIQLAIETDMIYNSEYKFVPRVGRTYHLYKVNGRLILSIINPDQWDKEHVGSFLYTADSVWKKVDFTVSV